MLTIANWNIEQMTGYKPKTTFYTDFSMQTISAKKPLWRHTRERLINGNTMLNM